MIPASILEDLACHNLFYFGKQFTKWLLVKLRLRSDANGIFGVFYAV